MIAVVLAGAPAAFLSSLSPETNIAITLQTSETYYM